MRRLRHFLGHAHGRTARRASRSARSTSAKRLAATFEPLEPRQLLAAHILASVDAGLLSAGQSNDIQLEMSGGPAILGFRMHGTGGTADPACAAVKDVAEHTIAPVLADVDVNGGNDSLVLANLGAGSYTVTTRCEGATTGTYRLDVFLPGDMNGDSRVDANELRWAQAAMVQAMGSWTPVTQLYYAQYGIDLTKNLYREEFDCDGDCRMDAFDLDVVTTNAAAGPITVTLVADVTPPAITARLLNDTGRSATDGISQDATITGTVTDEHEVIELRVGIDGMAQADYHGILGQVDASGSFQLSLAQLEAIAGGSLANNGAHTLYLIATDEYDNVSAPRQVTFQLDTVAPAAPTGLDLAAASDLGFLNTDNITSDNTPTLTASAESGVTVALYSNVGGKVGEALAGSTATITATTLANGVHQMTAKAIDAAGNTSEASTALAVTIDTVAPAVPTLGLAAADDTGTLGDQMTSKTSVTLEGAAEAGSRVTLNGASTVNADATTGAFSFGGVALAFGVNSFTVVSMDVAGNTRGFTRAITQNTLPALGTAVGPIAASEDVNPAAVSLATLFADANLASGDTLTLSIVGNTNAALVTPTLSGTTGQVTNSQLQLALAANQRGTATLTIRATDKYGETVDAQVVVNVAAVNDAPVVQTQGFSTPEDTAVSVDLWTLVSDVETPDSQLAFAVSSPVHGTAVLQADGHTVVFTPEANFNVGGGMAGFSFSVTDTGDGTAAATTVGPTAVNVTVTPVNDAPVASTAALEGDENTAVDVDLRTLVADVETGDNALIFTVGGGVNGTVTLLADGHTARFTPTTNFNGAASFTYSVTDTGDGGAAAKTVGPTTVTVTVGPFNSAPVAQTGNFSTNEDTAKSIDLWDLASDVETPDAQLVFTVANPTGGTAVLQADGHTVIFTPTPNTHGAGGFTYSVTDTGDGALPAKTTGPTAVNVAVNPVNDTPVAVTTTLVTNEDTAVDVDLRTLVTDLETADEALVFTVASPNHGAVSLLADGHTARFTPAANYNGAASFTYSVTDTGDGSAAAKTVGPTTISVTVNAVNDAPVAQTTAVATNEDTALSVDLWTLVSDVETADAQLVFTVASPSGGTAVLQADGHTVLFTPTANYHGAGSFTYSVTDTGDGTSAAIQVGPRTVSVTVNPVNDAPVASTTTLVTNEDTAVDVDLRTLVTDVETADDALVFTVAGPTHGTVSLLADGHTARFTPAANYNGAALFTYSVTDTGDGTAAAKTVGPTTISVTVNAVNDAPVGVADSYAAGVNETLTVSAANGVLKNDTDVEGTALTAALVSSTAHGTLTLNPNGSFTYTPATDYVGADTFTYKASDGVLQSATTTVTINVAANQPPDAVNDTVAEANEDTLASGGGLLDNDSDPDGDPISVVDWSPESAQGAAVTVDANGNYTYDPRAVAALQSLGVGHYLDDTFTYTISDGRGGQDTATVTIRVNGRNDLPTATDKTATTDEDTPLTQTGLLVGASDPDSTDLLLVDVDASDATSEKGASVTYTVQGGFTYNPGSLFQYLNDGESTTDTFDFVVKDPNGGTATATMTVTITGKNETTDNPVNVYLVVRETATPDGSTHVTTLPTSITSVAVGSTYVVEIWMRDTSSASQGLVGGEFDVLFNPALSQGAALTDANHAGPFFMLHELTDGTVDNVAGLVDDFMTGTIAGGLAVTPYFGRLGYVTFTASAEGVQSFTFGTGVDTEGLSEAQVALKQGGYVDQSLLNLGSAVVNQVAMETVTFTITESSYMTVGGVINGATLVPPPGQEPATTSDGMVGSIQVRVDSLDNPSEVQVVGGSVDISPNIGAGPFRPGIGGTDSTAYGDFAMVGEVSQSELIELAIRDLLVGFSSDVIPVDSRLFWAQTIEMEMTNGYLDVLSPAMGSDRYNLTDQVAEMDIERVGSLVLMPGTDVYQFTFQYSRTIDIGAMSATDDIQPGSYLAISGRIIGEYDTGGGSVMGTEAAAADTGTGVAATLSRNATPVVPGGQVSALPTSDAWVDEWDSYWVEVWAKTDEAGGVAAAKVDLHYNSEYFTAVYIDHGGTFIEGATGSLAEDGVVRGLGGGTSLTDVGGSGYALVGRVRFASIGGDGVDLDPNDLVIGPHDLGLRLENVEVDLVGEGPAEAQVWRTPETELWAVPYDVDDDGQIGLGDLSYFAASYGSGSVDAETAFGAALDFDQDGQIALGDLSYFASNYGKARGGASDVTYPESFARRWIGAGLETEGDATVADVLDRAIESWQEALGLPTPIEIQLVVTDFGSAQLAEAVILDVDATGIPTSGRVVLDDDANGLGWSTRLTEAPAAGQYDLYTVLLHEIGHTLGFMSSHEGFAEHIETVGDESIFVAAGVSVALDVAGDHVADGSVADDLMSSTLAPGVRKSISDLDVQMLLAAYQSASAGAVGYSSEGAAVMGTAGLLSPTIATTSEFGMLGERLEGDVTWEQLGYGVVGDEASRLDGAEILGAAVDAVDWLYTSRVATDPAGGGQTAGRAEDEGESFGAWFDELATRRASDEAEEDAADRLLADWEKWSV